jgi:cytochrome c oxidase subunit 6b
MAIVTHTDGSYQNYIDYYKCINAKGEDFAPCKQFYRAYHSLCPSKFLSS